MSLKRCGLKGDGQEDSTTKTRDKTSEGNESNHTRRAAVLAVDVMLGLFVGSPLIQHCPFELREELGWSGILKKAASEREIR